MENKRYFSKTNIHVEEPIQPGQKRVKVFWSFEGLTKDQIDMIPNSTSYAVLPGCSCTADIEVTEEGIIAYYDDNTKRKEVLSSQNREKTVGKNVRVYLKDGKPLYVKNERGVYKPNVGGKENILLTFNVIVQA